MTASSAPAPTKKGIRTYVNRTDTWTDMVTINKCDLCVPVIEPNGTLRLNPLFLDLTPYKFDLKCDVSLVVKCTGRPWVAKQSSLGKWSKFINAGEPLGFTLNTRLVDESLMTNPENLRLDIKVTNPNGSFAGIFENLKTEEGEMEEQLDHLLPLVDNADLGDRLCRVEFRGEERPVLLVSTKLSGGKLRINQPEIRAVAVPDAVDKILNAICAEENDEEDFIDDSDSWRGMWLRWTRQWDWGSMPDNTEDRAEWVNNVITAWCNVKCRFLDKLREE